MKLIKAILLCIGILSCQVIHEQTMPDTLKSWVSFLSGNDKMGRANGSEELKTVSQWIRNQFQALGLEPFIGDSTYFQNYSYSNRQDRKINERNVIGVLRGSESTDSKTIIISAHFDHIGIASGEKDSICNGADDNASGIAVLMAIAKYFHDSRITPRHQIVFAAFSGEEQGMQGSEFFCKNMSLAPDQIYLNLNFDMVGRSDELGKRRFYITGSEYTNLVDILNEYNRDKTWQVVDMGDLANLFFIMSDNISFADTQRNDETGIPAHTLAIGVGNSYLHKPNDEAQYLDYDNMSDFANYLAGLIIHLSGSTPEILWRKSMDGQISLDLNGKKVKIRITKE